MNTVHRPVELIIRVRYDPAAPSEVNMFPDMAERPVIEVGTLDPNPTHVGNCVLALLRSAVAS